MLGSFSRNVPSFVYRMIASVNFAMAMYRKLHREARLLLRVITYVIRVRGDLYIGEFAWKRKSYENKKILKFKSGCHCHCHVPVSINFFCSALNFGKIRFVKEMTVIYKIGR